MTVEQKEPPMPTYGIDYPVTLTVAYLGVGRVTWHAAIRPDEKSSIQYSGSGATPEEACRDLQLVITAWAGPLG